ncbi:MAG: hypothetical protein C5B46_03835 [Proteobacteria bacterium]|nr:MAG: hypothetical protein C5B46_03835 [Pseudomonadota bacterium]
MRGPLLALVLLALFGAGHRAAADSPINLTILDTDPGLDARLHYREPFYLRYKVESNAPVRVAAEAYCRGEEVPVATLAERALPAGGGTDATFIFHWPEQPTPVDEIRLTVRRDGQKQPDASVSIPVSLTWDAKPMPAQRSLPEWVRGFELQREQELAADPDYQAYKRRTTSQRGGVRGKQMATVFSAAALLVGLVVTALSTYLMWSWRGLYRALSVVPLALLAYVIRRSIGEGRFDASTQNLWPFEVLGWLAAGLAVLGVAWSVTRGLKSRNKERDPEPLPPA